MPVTAVFADKGVYCRNGQNVPKKNDPAGIAGIGYWLFHTLLIHYPYLRVAWEWEDGGAKGGLTSSYGSAQPPWGIGVINSACGGVILVLILELKPARNGEMAVNVLITGIC